MLRRDNYTGCGALRGGALPSIMSEIPQTEIIYPIPTKTAPTWCFSDVPNASCI